MAGLCLARHEPATSKSLALAQHFLLRPAPMTHSLPAREPTRLFLHLLPCLALAVVCTVLFCWKPFWKPPKKAWFEAVLQSEKPGTAGLHYDVDAVGPTAAQPASLPVPAGRPTRVRFEITAGKLTTLIFVPRAEE